ncbi:MAG: hypothetical protein FXF47_06415 [Candidatus Mcinerneyibacterium aminivorans]|jgi:hypothetical protein|uniref:Lipoprotein n=1 Tax=Candidatus Mcinerneyibacterium aminivorans TaxID=2703815 RepID=A0A5D0MHG0_9BACT|nr:MAG: hypothetical protein FXF47_06415 [Candidatus Mcinerneyibacterium aminivorans]
MLISKPRSNVLKILLIVIISILIFSCTKKNIKRRGSLETYKGRVYFKAPGNNYKSYFTLKEYENQIDVYFYTKFGNDLGYIKYKKFAQKKFEISAKDDFVKINPEYRKLLERFFDRFESKNFEASVKGFNQSLKMSKVKVKGVPKKWDIEYNRYKIRLIFNE